MRHMEAIHALPIQHDFEKIFLGMDTGRVSLLIDRN
jgi:hypothetical protein